MNDTQFDVRLRETQLRAVELAASFRNYQIMLAYDSGDGVRTTLSEMSSFVVNGTWVPERWGLHVDITLVDLAPRFVAVATVFESDEPGGKIDVLGLGVTQSLRYLTMGLVVREIRPNHYVPRLGHPWQQTQVTDDNFIHEMLRVCRPHVILKG